MIWENKSVPFSRCVYDTADRLIEVRDASNVLIATYSYDPFNRRIAKETTGPDAARTWFFYADEGLVAEADGGGLVAKIYGYRPGSTWGTNPVYVKQGTGTYYYYQNDHLDTPQKLVTQDGTVVWSATAEAFGNTTVDSASTITNNLRFPGQYYDDETGLHYNWNRYYDPATGRYVTTDPIGLRGGLNTYLYVSANPVMLSDPWGLAEAATWSPPPGKCQCPGGAWSQELGDSQFSMAWGGYVSIGNVNVTCRTKSTLKCKMSQRCIGGGAIGGAGLGFNVYGSANGLTDAANFSGWSDWNVVVVFPIYGPVGGSYQGQGGLNGGSVSGGAGPNVGPEVGIAAVRCYTTNVRCTGCDKC